MAAISYLLLVLFWSQLERFGTTAVRIDINPAKSISTLEKEVQISCLPDKDNDQEIKLMELSRNNEAPLVFINQCDSTPSHGDFSTRLEAVGHIGRESDQSYLNVTLRSPIRQDAGIYTCVLYFMDKTNYLKMQSASRKLLIEDIDVKFLETFVIEMKEAVKMLKKTDDELHQQDVLMIGRVTELENSSKNQIQDIKGLTEKDVAMVKRVTVLERSSKNQVNHIKELTEKADYQNAFTVTNNRGVKNKAGTVIILPKVIVQIGKGYDVKKGIFTAPRDGLYVFHLVVDNVIIRVNEYLAKGSGRSCQNVETEHLTECLYCVLSPKDILTGWVDTLTDPVYDLWVSGVPYNPQRAGKVYEPSCPSEWTLNKHSCFQMQESSRSWTSARDHCNRLGSHLAKVLDKSTNDFIIRTFSPNYDKSIWIGLNDIKRERRFHWIGSTDTPKFFNWDRGEPNNQKGNQDCVYIRSHKGGRWDDAECSIEHKVLCEKEAAFGCHDVKIYAKGTSLSRLNVYNQKSFSSVVSLTAGDKVFMKVLKESCNSDIDMHLTFTGYLIKVT